MDIKYMKLSSFLSSSALCVGVALCAIPLYANPAQVMPLQKQRIEILHAANKGASALPMLSKALQSKSPLIRRAAVRSLGQIGKPAKSLLEKALKTDKDALTRRTAMRMLVDIVGKSDINVIAPALNDNSELVRAAAVQKLVGMRPYSKEVTTLLKKAQNDASSDVSQIASQALWSFHKAGVSFRELPGNKDHDWDVIKKISLPEDGWKFHLDSGRNGQLRDWFEPSFDDSKWQDIKIGEAWDGQIGKEYIGVAWYRRSFTLPKKSSQKGTDIVFDGVDEMAWVWINGTFVGDHDVGLSGWDKRFAIDVTDNVKWGVKNQITVRVLNTVKAGGIWKPVYLDVLNR